ncbi:MAG: DUF1573 domain-containing protein [Puniceicoccaceae bacterium]
MKLSFALWLPLSLVAWSTTHAALEWKHKELRIPAELGEEKLVVEFPFRNDGDEAIVILDIKHSCGCTTGKLEQEVYEPGERGSLAVTIDLRNMRGELVKKVTVTSSGSDEATDVLWLYTDVPVPFKLSPAILSWKSYGDIVSKRLKLWVHPELVVNRESLEVVIEDRDQTGALFQPPVLGGSAEGPLFIDVEPAALKAQSHSYLSVFVDTPEGRKLAGEAYLLIH